MALLLSWLSRVVFVEGLVFRNELERCVSAAEPDNGCLVIEALEDSIQHGAEFQRDYMHLHAKLRNVVLN
jgi:hypothetical protein